MVDPGVGKGGHTQGKVFNKDIQFIAFEWCKWVDTQVNDNSNP